MTYNFDPDKWYDRERTSLAISLRKGAIDPPEFERALAVLDRKFDEMLKRIDGTYKIPKGDSDDRD